MTQGQPLAYAIHPSARLLEADTGVELSGADVTERAIALAASMRDRGLEPGDRLAILGPQTVHWYVVHLAADLNGVLTVPLNTRYTDHEIEGVLAACRPRAVVVDTTYHGRDYALPVRRHGAAHELAMVATLDEGTTEGWPTVTDLAAGMPSAPLPHVTDSEGAICFGTSGTTSAPKLAVHSRYGVSLHAAAVGERLRWSLDDVVLSILPPSGAYGYTVAMAAMIAGSRVVLVRTFQAADLAGLVSTHGATFAAATEPILRATLESTQAVDLRSLRHLATAGGSLAEVAKAFAEVGVPLLNVYGSSEALALTAIRDPDETGSAPWVPGGRLIAPGMEIRVVDEAGTTVEGPATEGELQLRGPTLFTGYLDQPEVTAAAFVEGWFRTQDCARIEAPGVFTFLARMTDTMRLHGYLVEPAQVEAVLITHPDVDEVEVVGVADPTGEDRAVAFVVAGAARSPTAEDLEAWCRSRLAAFKVPSHFLLVDAIPKTPSANGDKALKRNLRDLAHQLLNG